MIKKSLRAYITGSQLIKFVLPPGKAVGFLFCQFFKQQIHRVLVFLVVLQHLHGVQHFQQGGKILLLHRGFVVKVGNQCRQQKPFAFFPERVAAGPFTLGACCSASVVASSTHGDSLSRIFFTS